MLISHILMKQKYCCKSVLFSIILLYDNEIVIVMCCKNLFLIKENM